MEEEDEAFVKEEEDLDEPILDSGNCKNLKRIIIVALIFILIIIGLILIIYFSISKTKEEIVLEQFGFIKCIYNITDTKNNIYIINPNFKNNQKISIIIDNNNRTVSYTNSYKFRRRGNHNITFILNEPKLNMKNMFKNISPLISVEMVSENVNLTNIEGAFENCQNLEYFKIDGFYVDNLKSMHKLLYNTPKLSKVDLSGFDTSLIEDFSFMFANSNKKKWMI